jgi:hypothetical protein
MNDSNYIKNYQNMLESDSILKNKTYNTKLDEDVSKSNQMTKLKQNLMNEISNLFDFSKFEHFKS